MRHLVHPLIVALLLGTSSIAAAEAPPTTEAATPTATTPPPCAAPEAPGLHPPGAQVVAGGREHHRPLWGFDLAPDCMRLEIPVRAAVRGDTASSFAVDRYGNELDPGVSLSPVIRLGARFDSGRRLAPFVLHAEYEHDLLTGAVSRSPGIEGQGYYGDRGLDHELRKAYVRGSIGRALHLAVGFQTSHWGMGLLANDGDHGWEPGSARFSDPRSGDRVLRAQLATGPHTGAGLLVAAGGDILAGGPLGEDDALLDGDHALEAYAAVLLGYGHPHGGGLYVVQRHQEASDGSATDVTVIDGTARTRVDLDSLVLGLQTELALLTGSTELGPTVEHPEHDVLAFGGALRASLDAGAVGTVIDLLYASGDQNIDDDAQNGFAVDPNFEMGLLLFRHVLAAQTARGSFTAGDPQLVGVPNEDLERIPTRGGPTNTIAVFPRVRYRPVAGLETYAGPLFAFAAMPYVDPFNTQMAGGAQRNSLDGRPGRYWGTELDAGIRYRLNIEGAELTLGVEAGALRPGSALRQLDGSSMAPVYGGRCMLDARL